MTPSAPRVLAVVLNWCAEDDTSACVLSLLHSRQTAQPFQLAVLIVDNASPDGSGARLAQRFPDLPYLQTGDNLGYAGGNAMAAQWALGRGYEFIFVVNDDATVDAHCLALLVRALVEDPHAGAASPLILHHDTRRIWFAGGDWMRARSMGRHRLAGTIMVGSGTPDPTEDMAASTAAPLTPRVAQHTFATGCAVLLRSATVAALGAFRPEFFAYVEDLELSVRFQRAGWRLLFVENALATHKVAFPVPSDSAFAIRQRDQNRRRLIRLHYRGAARAAAYVWLVSTRLLHMMRFAARGDLPRLKAVATGLAARI